MNRTVGTRYTNKFSRLQTFWPEILPFTNDKLVSIDYSIVDMNNVGLHIVLIENPMKI